MDQSLEKRESWVGKSLKILESYRKASKKPVGPTVQSIGKLISCSYVSAYIRRLQARESDC